MHPLILVPQPGQLNEEVGCDWALLVLVVGADCTRLEHIRCVYDCTVLFDKHYFLAQDANVGVEKFNHQRCPIEVALEALGHHFDFLPFFVLSRE